MHHININFTYHKQASHQHDLKWVDLVFLNKGYRGDLLILREVINSTVVCVQAVALMQDNYKLDPLFRETA